MEDRAEFDDDGWVSRDELAYPWITPPAPARLCEVAPGVFWLRMPLPFALDHINLWLLQDDEDWAIVDTGICTDEVKALWLQLFAGEMGNRAVGRIITTHFHPDHFGLAGWLQEQTGAPLVMTRTEWLMGSILYRDNDGLSSAQQVSFYRRNGLDSDSLATLEKRGNTYRRVISPPPTAFHRLADGDMVTVGAHDWRVVVGTGHAPEHACLYCEGLNILIAGDQVLPRISPNVTLSSAEPHANPLADYLDSLERLRRLDANTLVLPSHGLPFRGLHLRVDQLRDHHNERLDDILVACERPSSAADMLPILFRRKLDAHQMMFAMGESLSHLAYLEHAGALSKTPDSDDVIRYERVASLAT